MQLAVASGGHLANGLNCLQKITTRMAGSLFFTIFRSKATPSNLQCISQHTDHGAAIGIN